MADDCGCSADEELIEKSPGYRRALWIVVVLNVGYGLIELFGGYFSNSQALKADALDFLGDGSITFIAILAIGWSLAWRARAAALQGVFLCVMAIWILYETVSRILDQSAVEPFAMGAFALGALIVNLVAIVPLLPYRDGDANVRAVWLFSRNDAIGNVAVLIAAGLVALTGAPWPDLVVALIIVGIFLHSAWGILTQARRDLRQANASAASQQVPSES
ncbi:cation diffusion facilitator family transporter [Hyphomonas sp.]|uniref:cation diffusion facilitator family transporter n=1 Tax=Hyphomonas sp. TaxID=87 RepID=UPI000DF96270|nr:cation diffusion facilitator family transporter [Hyphomonas sp.]RCL90158.1 MAG: cation transporter [Hyphomonas sp.]